MIKQKNKSGITITSLVIYVILLFAVMTLVLIITSSFNERMFTDRGMAININSVNKLQYNIFNSAELSNKASVIDNKISFSNGDIYTYDAEKSFIYKNNSVLVENVSEFTATDTASSEGVKVSIVLKATKYLSEISREVVVFVED